MNLKICQYINVVINIAAVKPHANVKISLYQGLGMFTELQSFELDAEILVTTAKSRLQIMLFAEVSSTKVFFSNDPKNAGCQVTSDFAKS